MANTRQDVVVAAKTWTDLFAGSGITSGTAVGVYNKGLRKVLLVIAPTAPASTTMGFPVYPDPGSNYANIVAGASGLWAYSEGGTSLLVQE